MKVMSVIRIFASVAGLVVLGDSGVHAQTEINPDHFDSPNAEPFPQPKTTTGSEVEPLRYDAEFTLPYKLQCGGKSLSPGKYSVSLRSDVNTGYATAKLNQKSQSLAITGVVRRHARKTGHDALIVEVDGKTCWLVVIRNPELDLVFDPRPQPENISVGEPRRIARFVLTQANQSK